MNIALNLYVLFGLLELLIVLLVVGAVAVFKWRAAQHNVEVLHAQLQKVRNEVKRVAVEPSATTVETSRGYEDFLREELDQSSILLGDDTQVQIDQDTESSPATARQMLAARHQFLQLELDVQGLSEGRDVEAQRQSIVDGMQALLAGLIPKPDAMDAAAETDDTPVDDESETVVSTARSEEDKLRDQVEFLRRVVSNQHDVMHELRGLLEEHGGDSDELQVALRKLGDAEKQGSELQRHLDDLEKENKRIKRAEKMHQGDRADVASPDSDMLRDLVGNQQRTIGNLQNMLRNLTPDTGKAKELEEIINKIQRSNNDLNSCVMVLEDENTHLRERVEALQEQVTELEANGATEREPVAVPILTADTAVSEDSESARSVEGDSTQVDLPVSDAIDVDVLLAESAPVEKPEFIDPEISDEDIDELRNTMNAESETQPAVSTSALQTGDDTESAVSYPDRDVVAEVEDVDVDALLAAASAPVSQPATTDLAESVDDVDALLDAALADGTSKSAESDSVADVQEDQTAIEVSSDADDFDIDALLAAAAPTPTVPDGNSLTESSSEIPEDGRPDSSDHSGSKDVTDADDIGEQRMEKTQPMQSTTKPPSLTQAETDQDDIDALLADLFAGDNKSNGSA